MLLAILGGRYVRRRPWIASGCGPTASPSGTTSAQHNPYWARMKISPKSGPRHQTSEDARGRAQRPVLKRPSAIRYRPDACGFSNTGLTIAARWRPPRATSRRSASAAPYPLSQIRDLTDCAAQAGGPRATLLRAQRACWCQRVPRRRDALPRDALPEAPGLPIQ